MTVRTRFAPSPTGFLHIGGARTALFSWAYAKKHGGKFILRIEDTDIERSTPEAVQAILDGMHWLGLDYDEGPFYQLQRMDIYKSVLQTMLDAGTAYHCYCSKEELESLREQQTLQGLKPRYDGKWRPETGKILPVIPQDIPPASYFGPSGLPPATKPPNLPASQNALAGLPARPLHVHQNASRLRRSKQIWRAGNSQAHGHANRYSGYFLANWYGRVTGMPLC